MQTKKKVQAGKEKKKNKKWLLYILIALSFLGLKRCYWQEKSASDILQTEKKVYFFEPPQVFPVQSFRTVTHHAFTMQRLPAMLGLLYVVPEDCEKQCVANLSSMFSLQKALRLVGISIYVLVISNADTAEENPVYQLIRTHYSNFVYYTIFNTQQFQSFFAALPIGMQNFYIENMYVLNREHDLLASLGADEKPEGFLLYFFRSLRSGKYQNK